MKILHFSDVHSRDKDLDELKKCLGAVVEGAQGAQLDLIVMAGDTFDNRHIQLDSQATKMVFDMYSRLADIAPMVVITGTPSHDGLTVQVLEHVTGRYPICVSEFPEQILFNGGGFFKIPVLRGTGPDAVISTVPTPTKQYWEEYGEKYESAQESDAGVAEAMSVMLANFGAQAANYDCPHILVGHFTVGGAFVSKAQPLIGVDIELSRAQIDMAEADLVCLGHIHMQQKIGDNIFYSGSTSSLNWGEMEAKGYYIHELLNEPPLYLQESRFIETPARKRVKLATDLSNGGRTVDEIIASIPTSDVSGALVRFNIKIFEDEADALDIEAIKQAIPGVDVQIQRVPRETVRGAKILKLETLREKFQEMALLRAEEVPESILAKADMLESMTLDEILEGIHA